MRYALFTLLLLTGLVTPSIRALDMDEIPAVQYISDGDDGWSGTSFQLKTNKGQVTITNKHVCDIDPFMFVPGKTGRKLAIVKAVSPKYDICMLTGIAGVPALKLAKDYNIGDLVKTDGFPFRKREVVIGRLGPYWIRPDRIEHSITLLFTGKVNPGASGSPVVNTRNEVVGIICTKQDDKFGGLVPLEALKDFLESEGYID